MRFLLENQTLTNDQSLFEYNKRGYAGIFSKVNAYNRRARAGLNESAYFSNKYAYNPDIMFTLEEQGAVTDMLSQMKAHLLEEMTSDIRAALIAEGVFDKAKDALKNGISNVKSYLGDKYKEITDKFAPAIKMLNDLLQKGIDSVKKFIGAIGELFAKLGSTLSEGLRKMGAFKEDDTAEEGEKEDVQEEFIKDVPQDERSFFAYVVTYVKEMMANDKDKAKQIMNEGVIDSVANNKYLQFVIGHRKGKRWGWWHTILVSIVGSLIVGIVLPMVLYVFGVSAATTVVVCTAVRIIWMSRGLVKVLLNRYLNKKPGEKFFDFWTCLGIVLSVLPLAVLQIPAVNEWMTNMVKAGFHALGLDKVIDSIEDWLAKIIEHFTGDNPTVETYQEPGKWIKEQIESIRNSGDTHVDLMGSGGAKAYIDNLFSAANPKSDLSSFVGNTGALKQWMVDIANGSYKSSMEMLNNLPTLSGEAPLTAVLDGNTFMHVSREALTNSIAKHASELGIHCDLVNVSEDLLREKTHNFAGTAYALIMDGNATSENAGIFNELMQKVAADMHVHDVTSFGRIMNNIVDFGDKWVDGDLNHRIIHNLFDTITQCFRPMFLPWFVKDKWGDYMLRLGSNASGMPAYRVTEVKSVKVDDLKELAGDSPAVALLLKHMDDVHRQYKEIIQASAAQEKKDNDGKVSKEGKSFFKRLIGTYNDSGDAEKREVMVVYVSGIIKRKDAEGKMKTIELKNEPAVVFDMNTLMCADIAKWSIRRRKTPYMMRGLFSKLDFVPTERNDNDTKQFIYDMLNKTMLTAVKQCVAFGTGQMYVTYTEDSDSKEKKYMPVDPADKDKRFFDCGQLSVQEICDVLNEKLEPYSLFAGKYGDTVSMKVDKKTGKLNKSAKENKKVIEKKRWKKVEGKFVEDPNGEYDYIDAKIIPFINRPNSAVYKELKEDKDVAELLFDKDGNMNTDIITDKTLNLKEFLYRPMQTFSKEDKVQLAKNVNVYLKGKSKKEKMDAYNTIKSMIEIIWVNMRKQIQKNRNMEDSKRKK